MSKHDQPPDALDKHPPAWHFDKFVEFTKYKQEIGEPSPHLAMVGHMIRGHTEEEKLWLLGTYAATYCLPSAQALWELQPMADVRRRGPEKLEAWLTKHWKGVVTRTERRCVRTPKKMRECLWSYIQWVDNEYPKLKELAKREKDNYSTENYDTVWESVAGVKFFGRYIAIRYIEGLRRYFGVPALLYDIRSVGGWSPKRALSYLYPQHTAALLRDDKESNDLTNDLAYALLARVQKKLPKVNEYVIAAMLCEYKGAFENWHQYPGHTIDQEPDLHAKVAAYWGNEIESKLIWSTRKALFPAEVLGELSGWSSYRHDLAKVLRDYGYNWSDLRYDYVATLKTGNFAKPVRWKD